MRKIKPRTDACRRGHYGQWRHDGKQFKCRACGLELGRQLRQAAKFRLAGLRAAYEATPGAMGKAARLLHVRRDRLRGYLTGQVWPSRWRVRQLWAVLELCILGSG